MTEWRWVLRSAVQAAHDRMLADYGGLEGVSLDKLEGALGRPQTLANYGQPEPDVADLAAAYAVGIAKAHAFAEGNKRTAWEVARVFLRLNGFTIRFEKMSAVLLMVAIADDKIGQAEVASWFRERLAPLA